MRPPERFADLPEYAFVRLRALLAPHAPGRDVIDLSLGEPKHPFPDWISDIIAQEVAGFGKYPPNDGSLALRTAYGGWIARRYGVHVDPDRQVVALNGTREGLYNAAMALFEAEKRGQRAAILMPNPFYPVYEAAARSIGAEPIAVPTTAEAGFLPDFSTLAPALLNRVVAVYICAPSNPQGAVADRDYWATLLALAEQYDFCILADECYSEIYRNAPPPGILECAASNNTDPERVLAFHSLSKRSNVPGLRSGAVVGGPHSISAMRKLRAYAGAPLPLPLQAVAAKLWADEPHVAKNRAEYAQKYALSDRILHDLPGFMPPQAGFFLWLPVSDDEAVAQKLWREAGIRVLPGRYLSKEQGGEMPGAGYMRVAMVAPLAMLDHGLTQIRTTLSEMKGK